MNTEFSNEQVSLTKVPSLENIIFEPLNTEK